MPRRNAVAIVADERQFPPAVFLAERLRRLNPRADVDIIIATSSLTGPEQARAVDPALGFIKISEADFDGLPPVAAGHITRATYFRLFLPRLLARTHSRILYLDVDVYPESAALFGLFDLDMGGRPVAAIRDLVVSFVANAYNKAELEDAIGLKGGTNFDGLFGAPYFNGGVELFDVDAYVRAKVEKKIMDRLRRGRHKHALMDQTVLNAAVKDNWLELSPRFNMVSRALQTFIAAALPPAITHFTGTTKPWHWHLAIDHPVRAEIGAFLRTSPWPNYLLEMNRSAASGAIPPADVQSAPWGRKGLAAIARHLRTTRFADVEQGLTTINLAAIPE